MNGIRETMAIIIAYIWKYQMYVTLLNLISWTDFEGQKIKLEPGTSYASYKASMWNPNTTREKLLTNRYVQFLKKKEEIVVKYNCDNYDNMSYVLTE